MTKEFHEMYEALDNYIEENRPAKSVLRFDAQIIKIENQLKSRIPEDQHALLDDLFFAYHGRGIAAGVHKFRYGMRCGAGLLPARGRGRRAAHCRVYRPRCRQADTSGRMA